MIEPPFIERRKNMESRSKVNKLFNQLKQIAEMPAENSLLAAWQNQIAARDIEKLHATDKPFVKESFLRQKAAVCVCFSGDHFSDASVLLTLRATHLPTHAGQVAFPGGTLEPQDEHDFVRAALRECREEVGFAPERSEVAGYFPPLPTFTGNFEVVPVLAFIPKDIFRPLLLSEEVALAEWVPVQKLIESRRTEEYTWKKVETRKKIDPEGYLEKSPEKPAVILAPYFMWGERKMWGLSAWIFDFILKRYDTMNP